MFTGIIQSTGKIEKIYKNSNTFYISTVLDLADCQIGSSVCCDGVCLTIISLGNKDNNYSFGVNVGEETLKRSNLIDWNVGSKINLEKSLKVGDEIAGHFVYGHVDRVLKVGKVEKFKNSWEYSFYFDSLSDQDDLKKFIVEKGSLAINGISLTVANVYEKYFNVSIIPFTYENTNLSNIKENDTVNIEFDPLARYISSRYE